MSAWLIADCYTIDLNTKVVSGAGHRASSDTDYCKLSPSDETEWSYRMMGLTPETCATIVCRTGNTKKHSTPSTLESVAPVARHTGSSLSGR